MKKIVIWIVAAAVCVALMVGAYALYGRLTENMKPDISVLPILPGNSETEGADTELESTPDSIESETEEPSVDSETEIADESETESETESAESETESTPETEVSEYLAPDFTVYDKDGNPVNLSDFFGKPIVVNFWASWCVVCEYEMPDFDEVAKKRDDVEFIMVNAIGTRGETVEKAKKFIEDNGYEFDVYYDIDQDALYTYGISSFPTTFFIASNGDLFTYYSGALDADTLEEIIDKVKEYDQSKGYN